MTQIKNIDGCIKNQVCKLLYTLVLIIVAMVEREAYEPQKTYGNENMVVNTNTYISSVRM